VADRSILSSVGSPFHTRGAEKALSPIRRRDCGMTRLPDDEARSADRAIYLFIYLFILAIPVRPII